MRAFTTSGTLPFLKKLTEAHPKLEFFFMNSGNSWLVYYEQDKKRGIFVSGRTYSILHTYGSIHKKGFVTMEHIPVTDDGIAVFKERFQQIIPVLEKRKGVRAMRLLKQEKKQEYVVMTQWETERYETDWRRAPEYEEYDVKKMTRLSAYFAERPFTNSYVMLKEEE